MESLLFQMELQLHQKNKINLSPISYLTKSADLISASSNSLDKLLHILENRLAPWSWMLAVAGLIIVTLQSFELFFPCDFM